MASTKLIPKLLSCTELKALLRELPKGIAILEADVGKQVKADFDA